MTTRVGLSVGLHFEQHFLTTLQIIFPHAIYDKAKVFDTYDRPNGFAVENLQPSVEKKLGFKIPMLPVFVHA